MKIKDRTITLHNGMQMPLIGFGTVGIHNNVASVIASAITAGYRHIETAPIYKNEAEIALGIEQSGIDRDALFITSKVPPHVKTYEGTLRMARRSMKKLGTDYLDALLINNPVPWGKEGTDYSKENFEVWRALQTLYDEEVVGAIGVSNFTEDDLAPIIEQGTVKPHINQLGVFIGHTLDSTRLYCKDEGIVIQGHSPLARGRLLKEPWLQNTASSFGVSAAQLALRFVVDLGVAPIVKSENPTRMEENLALDFTIDQGTVSVLKQTTKDVRDYLPPGATRQL